MERKALLQLVWIFSEESVTQQRGTIKFFCFLLFCNLTCCFLFMTAKKRHAADPNAPKADRIPYPKM